MRPRRASALWLQAGVTVENSLRGHEYRIERLLGRGGFGVTYVATRRAPRLRCVLKLTTDAAAWHREAYFGDLLRHVPALVDVHDSFAWMPEGGRHPIYCLVSEFVEGGDLRRYLERNPAPWSEARARREIVRLLHAVTMIHESGAVHRDITPSNVFVSDSGRLKLGDFGIALHRVGRRDVAADAFAPHFAPGAIQDGAKRWRQSDDVHQIGQLYAALLSGIGTRRITAKEVQHFPCSPGAKTVLQRCIGPRSKCFEHAAAMLEAVLSALKAPSGAAGGRGHVASLRGKRLVFTGGLSILRAEAKKLARRAGATVQANVGHETDIVVVGDQSPHWKAEAKGQKLLDVDHEAERGHKIAIVKESRFLSLVRRLPD